ncbi:hypothetical protein [Pseudomonas phage vB_PseuGesM_254]|uniref:Uncharacterized protein n=1 Tax=Pseudomonas phage vB_PseuGesM_254 TaxID=3092638 RepID=A0AAX4G691_9CAUD|nr:hypothetical protein [Pseudomonas phage PseuGes_254]
MMNTIVGWKLMGERPDGSEIEGDIFASKNAAEYEGALLLMEFPANSYWIETIYEVVI